MLSLIPVPLTCGLTPNRIVFAECFSSWAPYHQSRAALMAGYAEYSAYAAASRLLRDPRILALIRYHANTVLRAELVATIETLKELRDDASQPALRQ